MIGPLFAMATYYPVYLWLAGVKDVALVSFGVFVLILATVFTFSILGTTLAELFPTRVRYTAMSMAFNPGVGFFGGFTPLIIQAIGLWLKKPTRRRHPIYLRSGGSRPHHRPLTTARDQGQELD
jgi:hypothetical protein